MKKIFLSLVFVCIIMFDVFAQQRNDSFVKKNAVYTELGGSGLLYSLNYEYRIPVNANQRLALGAGTSVIGTDKFNFIGITSVNYLIGRKNIFEVGISPAYIFTNSNFLMSARIGYRYESSSGLLFRVGFSPIYGKFAETGLKEYSGKVILPWGYLSVGYTF